MSGKTRTCERCGKELEGWEFEEDYSTLCRICEWEQTEQERLEKFDRNYIFCPTCGNKIAIDRECVQSRDGQIICDFCRCDFSIRYLGMIE